MKVQRVKIDDVEKTILLNGAHRLDAYQNFNELKDYDSITDIPVEHWKDGVIDYEKYQDEMLRFAHNINDKQAGQNDISYTVFKTRSNNDIILRAIELNATCGLQLNYKEKKSLAVKLYHGDESRKKLLKALSVSESTFDKWTKNKKRELDDERDDKILDLYLQCWTQQQIADEIGTTQDTIKNILRKIKEKPKFTEIFKMSNFKPKPYNIWNYQRQDTDTTVFGTLPQDIVEQLLYYYTEPFDVVYDPFGGAGITVDACKRWFRRYYVSDAFPTEIALTKNIKEWKWEKSMLILFLDRTYNR